MSLCGWSEVSREGPLSHPPGRPSGKQARVTGRGKRGGREGGDRGPCQFSSNSGASHTEAPKRMITVSPDVEERPAGGCVCVGVCVCVCGCVGVCVCGCVCVGVCVCDNISFIHADPSCVSDTQHSLSSLEQCMLMSPSA